MLYRCIAQRFCVRPVSGKNKTPPEKKTRGKASFRSTSSGAGDEFLLQDCRGEAHSREVFFHRHRYVMHTFVWSNG